MTLQDYSTEELRAELKRRNDLAKVSKRDPNVMLNDRREITEGEILMLIDCYMRNKCQDEEYKDGVVFFKSRIQEGKIIEIRLKDKPQDK